MISVTRLQEGDSFLGYTPDYVEGVVKEMTVMEIRKDVIKVKKSYGTGEWYPKKNIFVYDILNRQVPQDSRQDTSYRELTVTDIKAVKVGDRILNTRPWCTHAVFEDVVQGISENAIKLDDDWVPKKDMLVIEVLSRENETRPQDAFCPLRSAAGELKPCDRRCKFFHGGCIWNRILEKLESIADNTDDDDDT